MNAPHCCGTVAAAGRRTTAGRRILGAAGWLVPGLTLALLPKCPACVAAYVALVTGIGLPIPAATSLRTAATVVCIALLSYAAARRLGRHVQKMIRA